jgi:hypothetical protein
MKKIGFFIVTFVFLSSYAFCFSSSNYYRKVPIYDSICKINTHSINKHPTQLSVKNLDSLWKELLFKEEGCLVGGQYVYDGRFGGEGCVMSYSEEWKYFFNFDKKQISEFLITKITSNTTKTKIHTCPYDDATEGEMAVYALQKIFLINWYDFAEFVKYKNKLLNNSDINHQKLLQNILANSSKREILINCWKNI